MAKRIPNLNFRKISARNWMWVFSNNGRPMAQHSGYNTKAGARKGFYRLIELGCGEINETSSLKPVPKKG